MFYRNRHMRRRGIYGFPWVLIFIFVFASHSMIGFMIGIRIAVGMSILIAALMNGGGPWSSMRMGYQPPYQPYQPPQPQTYYQPPYTPPQQPYVEAQEQYQPYEQGYQAAQERSQENESQDAYTQENEYSQYEQPQSQYPEPMPPMQ